jgi:DNA mismatch endonuclease (patch repair protein)
MPVAKERRPQTNAEFWQNKFAHNVANDTKNKAALESTGFQVIMLWECERLSSSAADKR